MLPMTHRAGHAALALLTAGVLLLGAAACSDDDEPDSSAAATTTAAVTGDESPATTGAITATGADAEWCEAMIDWSQDGNQVRLDDTQAFNDYLGRLQDLAADAPAAIAEPMGTVAASTQAVIDDPNATADVAAQDAAEQVAVWVLDNCGYDLNA